MATIVNHRDVLLQAAAMRLQPITLGDNIIIPAVRAIQLTAPSLTFQVNTSGVATPGSIVLTATLKQITGTPAFSVVSGSAGLSGSGSTRTLAYVDMLSDSVTIRASLTYEGELYSSDVTIAKVRDGLNGANGDDGADGTDGTDGTPGQRGPTNVTYTVSGLSAWSDAQAEAALTANGYVKVLMDRVTLRNSSTNPTYIETRYWSGFSWLNVGVEINGNLLVSGTITGDKLAANTITATNIAGLTITSDKIASGAITATKLAAGAITADMITSGNLALSGGNMTAYNGLIYATGISASGGTIEAYTAGMTGVRGWSYAAGGQGVFGYATDSNANSTGVHGQSLFGPGLRCTGKFRWGGYTWDSPSGSGTSWLCNNGNWSAPTAAQVGAVSTTGKAAYAGYLESQAGSSGTPNGHKCRMHWTGTKLQFWVDATMVIEV